jgi:hypothetical protein
MSRYRHHRRSEPRREEENRPSRQLGIIEGWRGPLVLGSDGPIADLGGRGLGYRA